MKKIGLDKLDVITVFERTFADRVMEDTLINHIARAVGEVIEENNKKLLEELTGVLKGGRVTYERYSRHEYEQNSSVFGKAPGGIYETRLAPVY